jgi:Zn-dependent protease with chaperone function
MAADVPYPPSPTDVPADYTHFSEGYRSKQRFLLVWSYLVLTLYLTMVLAAITSTVAGVWLCFAVSGGLCFGPILILASLLTLAYLVKNLFFKSDYEKRELSVEITEEQHPKLFGFVERLCEELEVDTPAKIHVLPEPDAMAMMPLGLKNLFVTADKELFIGIGLINALNLSEFKAVMAHELGHFSQFGKKSVYVGRISLIVSNMIVGQDEFEKNLREMMSKNNYIAHMIHWVISAIKSPLLLAFIPYARTSHDLAREAEFHADRVSASLAGSNASVHALFRSSFAAETYVHALDDLMLAKEHKLFTSDIYYHQHGSGDVIRRKKRDAEYGQPPKYASPIEGKRVQIFPEDAEEDHPPGDVHPTDHEREENIKNPFIPWEIDERSAWILFDNVTELREQMTYKMYRSADLIKKGQALDDPRVVQKFLDEEHQETTYDPRYRGAYDDRLLNPGPLEELDNLVQNDPWDDKRLASVYEKLYDGLEDKVEERKEIQEELFRLRKDGEGARSKKIRKAVKGYQKDLEDSDSWFRTLDRRVYLVSMQMSYRVNHELYHELINRYRFHMVLQGIYLTAKTHDEEADFHLTTLFKLPDDFDPVVRDEFLTEVLHVLREARKALREVLKETRDIDMPAMKHFEEGENLSDFLLDEELVRPAGEHGVSVKWLNKLFRQINEIRGKAARLHFKSLGQILALQERIAQLFLVAKGFRQKPVEDLPAIVDG